MTSVILGLLIIVITILMGIVLLLNMIIDCIPKEIFQTGIKHSPMGLTYSKSDSCLKKKKAKFSKTTCDSIEIDRLKIYEQLYYQIVNLPNCNTCSQKECVYKPKWGNDIRFNCPLYKPDNPTFIKEN